MRTVRLRSAQWDAGAMMESLRPGDLSVDSARLSKLESFFWFDLCAEYDSQVLHAKLVEIGADWSQGFHEFERLWYRDEMNHYRGFRELYRGLFGVSDRQIDDRLARRTQTFQGLEGFLETELKALVLFSYDELATTLAYSRDRALYRELGSPRLLTFLRRLIRDESYHFQNAADLVRLRYLGRPTEVLGAIADCVRHDLEGHPYQGVFLFDHDWEEVPSAFFEDVGRRLARHWGLEGHVA
ncbi:MAG TPA: hypothetical protein ENK43_13190 [Planctomycetes bacterium]|nr:hypothetical protein [Planctomycetota bacterium]